MPFGILIIMAIYLFPLAFVVWVVLGLVRSLKRLALAQESTSRALEQIAGHMAGKL